MEETIHPYFLKQYNNRWFVLGYNQKYEALTCFALDRIIAIHKANVTFIPNTKYDFEQYFKDVVGVTVFPSKVEEVLIEVDKSLYPYISSKPIHHSQTLVRYTPEGNAIISLHVIPNYELKQLLISHGHRVAVISPQQLREEMCEEMRKILQKYESAQFG